MVKLKFKDMGRVMKLKDLFGPFAAYVKKNEPLACSKRSLPPRTPRRGVRPGLPEARGCRADCAGRPECSLDRPGAPVGAEPPAPERAQGEDPPLVSAQEPCTLSYTYCGYTCYGRSPTPSAIRSSSRTATPCPARSSSVSPTATPPTRFAASHISSLIGG